ncbi:MAG: hypothetical protein RIA64_15570 [Rhodospirillales bacterium]
MAQKKSLLTTLAALATIIAATIVFIEFAGAKKGGENSEARANQDAEVENSQKSMAIGIAGPGGNATATSTVSNTSIVNQIDNRISAEGGAVVIIQRDK